MGDVPTVPDAISIEPEHMAVLVRYYHATRRRQKATRELRMATLSEQTCLPQAKLALQVRPEDSLLALAKSLELAVELEDIGHFEYVLEGQANQINQAG